jgi:hypothetical protein
MANWIKFDGSEDHKRLMHTNIKNLRVIHKQGAGKNSSLFADVESFLIGEPHPHRDMIIEWANTGRPVWVKDLDGTWKLEPLPCWNPEFEHSFDPPKKKIKYRVALMKDKYGDAYTETANSEVKEVRIESNEHFIKWITDWQGVEIDE